MLTQVAERISLLIEINFTFRGKKICNENGEKKVFFKECSATPSLFEFNQKENPSNETICPFIKINLARFIEIGFI